MSNIQAHNGGSIVAMAGKDCVAIATDKRFGVGLHQISTNFDKVYRYGPRLFAGYSGLATDILTCHSRLRFRVNMYELRENRKISPKTFSALFSNFLYEKRFSPYFIEPIVVGLDDKTGKPYVSAMDSLGCICEEETLQVAGTASEQLFGMCESLWEPNLDVDSLFEVISQSLMNACDRDAISGWGATVYLIEKDAVTVKELKMRMD